MDNFRDMDQRSYFLKFLDIIKIILVFSTLSLIIFFLKFHFDQKQEIQKNLNLLKSLDFISVYRFYFLNNDGKLNLVKSRKFYL